MSPGRSCIASLLALACGLTAGCDRPYVAREAFREVTASYPESDLVDDAEWMIENMEKPNLDIEELDLIIERSLETLKLKREVEELRKQFVKDYNLENIVAQSPTMKLALRLADTIARSYDTTVLIEGKTGTGKEVIARLIHHRSDRFDKPFVSINCGAISKDLV